LCRFHYASSGSIHRACPGIAVRLMHHNAGNILVRSTHSSVRIQNDGFELLFQGSYRSFAYGSSKLFLQEQTSQGVRFGVLSNSQVAFKLINQCLERTHVGFSCRLKQHVRSSFTEFQPLFFVAPEFIGREFPPARMLVIVAMDFGVTFKTHWDGVINRVGTAFTCRQDMIRLNFDPTEAVTDTAAPMTCDEEFINEFAGKRHDAPFQRPPVTEPQRFGRGDG
jgi:hypothetical protein